LDDDFNVSEVEKTKDVKVPGYSIMFSVNKNGKKLINRLLAKGILTQEDQYFRFLFSPQLKLSTKNNYFIFHTGQYAPQTESSKINNGVWTQRGTRLVFSLDSLSRFEAFGSIYIPVNRIINRNRFF
jgi:hypothetical protein